MWFFPGPDRGTGNHTGPVDETQRRHRPVEPNLVPRERLRAGVVECPLCGRQLATPSDHLVVYGAVDRVTVENADAIECPVCDGVTFIDDAGGAE